MGETKQEERRVHELVKGTVITCPLCDRKIGVLKESVRRGEVIGINKIRFFKGKPKEGDFMLCPWCGFPYAVKVRTTDGSGSIVHTEHGWLPLPYAFYWKGILIDIRRFLEEKGMWRKEWDENFKKKTGKQQREDV